MPVDVKTVDVINLFWEIFMLE